MVLNAAVQMLREADELKEKISKFKSGTSMLQERTLWATQQELQKIYQKVLILDLDYALDKKVEQDLWNVGFKQQIEALQAISKDKKNPLRSEGQAMLSWVLQAAAGFYLCLLHQICTTFQLDLPFRRRASLLGCVEGWGAGESGGCGAGAVRVPASGAARYICQHCLVHLGDLARYRHQLRVAHTFYRHAVCVCCGSGQPYNQLALVAGARRRPLCAAYWHVRSLLVRAPFPPAAANLARALASHAHSEITLPCLPGVTSEKQPLSSAPLRRLDAPTCIDEFLRALHYIHINEELDLAKSLVDSLSTSFISLIATESFESMMLIKMSCIIMWAVHSTHVDGAQTEAEATSAALAERLARAMILALLLPVQTAPSTLSPLKVWLQWMCSNEAWRECWRAPALWAALGDALNHLVPHADNNDSYASVPLPEDEELHGFLLLESAFSKLRFPHHHVWDTYADRVPTPNEYDDESPSEVPSLCLSEEPELQKRVRAHRILQLGKQIAILKPEYITYTEEESLKFSATTVGGSELVEALETVSLARRELEDETPRPPLVISEADFREKVREKRAGILKPQGSLERAREERAMATQEDVDEDSEVNKFDDKKELKKSRVNIAMAAIMRKQEEINKQVKFVSPPPTPESTADSTESKDDKPKMIQPKAIKSLANLPIGRKTGGILSLKDKSGYPHLVNNDEKTEKEDKKEIKPPASPSNFQKQNSPQNWTPPQQFNEPRTFQKNYGLQNSGLNYNPNYQSNQGIRLPVVNPKEIDVRSAALQKQSSRQDMFQEGGHKFNYQISGDKKNFLNDLPPRFANQYRYWQNTQENQFNDNKFRDENFKSTNNNGNMFNQAQQSSRWVNSPMENYQQVQQPPWWKPDQSPNFNYTPTMVQQPNFFPTMNNVPNPYPNMAYNLNKPETSQPYLNNLPSTIGQPMQTLQNLVSSPNFNSSLNNFNTYQPVQYDSSMYPQFNKMSFPPQKPLEMGGFNNSPNFDENIAGNALEQNKMGDVSSEGPGNTYSLFSGAPSAAAWGSPHTHPQQSLWSGPGPSPLERLLEQQKQMKPPSQ